MKALPNPAGCKAIVPPNGVGGAYAVAIALRGFSAVQHAGFEDSRLWDGATQPITKKLWPWWDLPMRRENEKALLVYRSRLTDIQSLTKLFAPMEYVAFEA